MHNHIFLRRDFMRKCLLLSLIPVYIAAQTSNVSDAIVKKIELRQKPGAWLLEMQQEVAYQYYGSKNAKQEYQILGKEAQNLVGIPEKEHVTVKKLAQHAPNYKFAPACMCNGHIFVKEEFMDKTWYGIKRISLIHEAVHKKQFRPIEQKVVILYPNKYNKIEREADMEASHLGKCWRCTYEFSLKAPRKKDNHPHAKACREQGYATHELLLSVSKAQRKQRLLCPNHKRSTWPTKINEEETYRKFYPIN